MDNNDRGVGVIRYFSGDGNQNDHQELKKFIKWARASRSCKKLEDAQAGPYLYTLLQGSALEAVDHLEYEQLEKDDGFEVLLDILLKR